MLLALRHVLLLFIQSLSRELVRKDPALHFFDANTIRSFLNNGHQERALAADGNGYGPIALYAGGKGAVHFRRTAYMDMSLKVRDEEKVGPGSRKQRLSDFYYSWGTAAADFNPTGSSTLSRVPISTMVQTTEDLARFTML
jgi:hypothetical protein